MLVLFTLPSSSSFFVSLLTRRIIRETMCALPQSLLLWFLLQCAKLVYKVHCFMVRFLDPRNRFSKKQRDKLHNRLFKERFKCHIWSYALQTIGCKDSLKASHWWTWQSLDKPLKIMRLQMLLYFLSDSSSDPNGLFYHLQLMKKNKHQWEIYNLV